MPETVKKDKYALTEAEKKKSAKEIESLPLAAAIALNIKKYKAKQARQAK